MTTLNEHGLPEWLRSEAAIADRPGQYVRLNDIADRVDVLLDRLAKVEALADEWHHPDHGGACWGCAIDRALASDPTHTQNGTQA